MYIYFLNKIIFCLPTWTEYKIWRSTSKFQLTHQKQSQFTYTYIYIYTLAQAHDFPRTPRLLATLEDGDGLKVNVLLWQVDHYRRYLVSILSTKIGYLHSFIISHNILIVQTNKNNNNLLVQFNRFEKLITNVNELIYKQFNLVDHFI